MNFFVVALFSFFLAVQASPLIFESRNKLDNLDVYVPQIYTPNGASNWCPTNQNVTWSLDPPKQISNRAAIFLNFPLRSSPSRLLAHDFDLRTGWKEIVIPADIPLGSGYTITLFGDSGDTSQEFCIVPCPTEKA